MQLGQFGLYQPDDDPVAVLWDAAKCGSNFTLSEGDAKATLTVAAAAMVLGDQFKSSGLLYFEVLCGGTSNTGLLYSPCVGVSMEQQGPGYNDLAFLTVDAWGYARDGTKVHTSSTAYGASYQQGDIIGCALNFTSGKIWFSKNGTWQNSGDPAAGTGEAYSGVSGSLAPVLTANTGSPSGTIRASSSACSYTPPTGFSYWAT